MDMLFRHTSRIDLAAIFKKNRRRSPAPHLLDPAAIKRARRLAREQGIWDAIATHMKGDRTIPVLTRSAYRGFERTGDRQAHQAERNHRNRALLNAYLAVWLGHPAADIDYLQDILWAWCDSWTWVMNAHEERGIDLGSVMLAAWLAEIVHVLGSRLEKEVTDRIRACIHERIFIKAGDYREPDFWHTVPMNWNHVCNGDLVRAALYLENDPERLAALVHGPINNMTYALDGFTDDGGCQEGPGYWNYGFGHYLMTAYALYCKTDGRINIMQDEKIDRICRYPLASHVTDGWFAPFADCNARWLDPLNVILINRFRTVPELFGVCRPHDARTVCVDGRKTYGRSNVKLHGVHALALYAGQKPDRAPDERDYLLPDLGQVKLKTPAGVRQLTLAALASHNAVPHSHNDVGTFVVARGGKLWLTDPGSPLYRKEVFCHDTRYGILHCRTRGHSVPVINGQEQRYGKRYRGTLKTENLNNAGDRIAVIDMSRAYPRGTVKKLVRTFTVSGTDAVIRLEDTYRFERAPKSLEEAFITLDAATVAADGRSVRIGPARKGVTITADDTPGRFTAMRLVEESGDGRGDDVVTRISFVPGRLTAALTLRFVIS